MIKRPLCIAAVAFLSAQAILAWNGFSEDLKPSGLEQSAHEGDNVSMTAVVFRREEKQNSQVYYLKDCEVHLGKQILYENKILIYFKTNPTITNQYFIPVGSKVKATGELSFFEKPRNPGNFDQKFYYQKQGIHAQIWADKIEAINSHVYPLRERLACLRARWKQLLIKQLGENYGNSMSAILLGEKSGMDSELKKLYQGSGIAHIFAISGLHMSFLGLGLYNILRKCRFPYWLAGTIGILFLSSYTLMIGCGVSSLRALIMFLIRIGADMTGRTYDLPTSLAAAAAVIAGWQRLYLLDAGFLLSFGALLGIAAVNPLLTKAFLPENPSLKKAKTGHKKACKMSDCIKVYVYTFMQSICASLSINLILFPIMLYFYFEFPPYSLILNLIVIPLMSAVLGAGITGSVLSILSGMAGGFLLQGCKAVLWLYEKLCQAAMFLPFSRIVTGKPAKWWIVIYYILLFLVCVCLYVENRREEKINPQRQRIHRGSRMRYLAGAVLAGWLLIPFAAERLMRLNKVSVTMIDVGQGDGIYLRGPAGRHYLIDGGSSDISSVGEYRLEPFLKSQGVHRLDYVFISHGDMDHISGIQEMLANQKMGIRIQTLVLPPVNVQDESLQNLAELAAQYHTRVTAIEAGQILKEKGLKLTCIAPEEDYAGESGNSASMVLDLNYGAFDMLFTGDLEGEGEKEVEQKGRLRRYDILKVPHHGSGKSSSQEFLSQTQPLAALISAGVDNQYGHPHKDTLERLRQAGSKVYCTKDCKAVTVLSDGKEISILFPVLEEMCYNER